MKCNDYFYSDMFLDVLSGFMVIILYVKKKKNYSLYIYGICNFKMLSMQWRIKLTSKYQIELISATLSCTEWSVKCYILNSMNYYVDYISLFTCISGFIVFYSTIKMKITTFIAYNSMRFCLKFEHYDESFVTIQITKAVLFFLSFFLSFLVNISMKWKSAFFLLLWKENDH